MVARGVLLFVGVAQLEYRPVRWLLASLSVLLSRSLALSKGLGTQVLGHFGLAFVPLEILLDLLAILFNLYPCFFPLLGMLQLFFLLDPSFLDLRCQSF